jgi:large subunit ribosomal protein L2
MPVKHYRPTSAGRRISSVDTFGDVTSAKPFRKLTLVRKQHAGRANSGKITVRHQGGGERRRLRVVDFLQNKYDIPGKILTIEYDPNRGARLALLQFADGEKRYILAIEGVKVGEMVLSSLQKGDARIGNRFPLELIPVGMEVCNVELIPGKGGQCVRGAGSSAQLMAVEGAFAILRFPSGETRMVLKQCMATIGKISNADRRLIRWGKAGRMRHRGIRPAVRGKVMNPVDHPHGGGEGRNSIGLKHPKTPSGKPAFGVKTRGKRSTDRLILQRRRAGRFVGGSK